MRTRVLFAKTPEGAKSLEKTYLLLSENLGIGKKNRHWQKLCKGLKKSNSSYRYQKNHFSGVRCKGKKIGKNRLYWQVNFEKKNSNISLVFSVNQGKYSHIFREVAIESTETIEKILNSIDPDILYKIIRFYTPYLGRVSIGNKSEHISIPENIKEDLYLFHLEFTPQKGFLPQIRGKAVMTGKRVTKGRKTYFKYKLLPEFYRHHPFYFVGSLSSMDPAVRAKEEESLFSQLQNRGKNIFNIFSNALQSSFSGIRYGVSAGSDEELLAKSSVVSFLLEIRDGIAKGLRFHYELAPEVNLEGNGTTESFSWSRTSLGYGLSSKNTLFLSDLITDADLILKTGSFSLGLEKDNLNPVHIENALSLGIEIGLLYQRQWLHSRVWFGVDSTSFSNTGSYSVTSLKLGFDLSFQILKFSSTSLSLLLFSNTDNLSISYLGDVSESDVTDLSYLSVFSGAGFLINW